MDFEKWDLRLPWTVDGHYVHNADGDIVCVVKLGQGESEAVARFIARTATEKLVEALRKEAADGPR